eukprot:gene22532-biopygen23736
MPPPPRCALRLACFRCGEVVRVQVNGLPLGHHLGAVLSSLMVSYYEVRRIPALAAGCGCGRVHPLLACRWRDDTIFVQRIPAGCSGADWMARLTGIYPTSLELEWSDGTGSASGVVWTDLVVDVHDGRVRVRPREELVASASEVKHVIPRRCFTWLWRAGMGIPLTYVTRLVDAGCWKWRVWEARAAVLLLAGYSGRSVAAAAAGALVRRAERHRAVALLRHWTREGLLRRWRAAMKASGAGPNDAAFINRIVAERQAAVRCEERACWAAGVRGTVGGGAAVAGSATSWVPRRDPHRDVGKRVSFSV